MVGRLKSMKLKFINCLFYLFLATVIYSCIEPYDFVVKDDSNNLVVEGFISDVSYEESSSYPSDGRYFSIFLSKTADVTNIRGKNVENALIYLYSDSNEEWVYEETAPGVYMLLDKCFKAEQNKKYRIKITLDSDEEFTTDWQSLPSVNPTPIQSVSFQETEEEVYKYIREEREIVSVDGIKVFVDIPVNSVKEEIYYYWDFQPTWEFRASLPPFVNQICYVSSEYYLSDFVLHNDRVGGYSKELFFEETTGNERFLWQFSLLLRQLIINKEYYEFLNDIKVQSDESLDDSPPYNLRTNILSDNIEHEVDGYFAVVKESATRWYFDRSDLSYSIEDLYKKDCLNPLTEIAPVCHNCMNYPNGDASTTKPLWWAD